MKQLTYILISILTIISCTNKKIDETFYIAQEDSLLLKLIDLIILPDSLVISSRVPPSLPSINLRYNQFNKRRDSMIKYYQNNPLYIAFDNRLMNMSKPDYSKCITVGASIEYFHLAFLKLDSSYYEPFSKLVLDTSLSERSFDFTRIKTNFKYQILSLDSLHKKKHKKDQVIEIHYLSRIAFSKDFKKACLYDRVICGDECLRDNIIFLTRENKEWEIARFKEY